MRDTRGISEEGRKKERGGRKLPRTISKLLQQRSTLYFLFDLPFGKGNGWDKKASMYDVRLMFRFRTLFPLSAFETDIYYKTDPSLVRTSYMKAPKGIDRNRGRKT